MKLRKGSGNRPVDCPPGGNIVSWHLEDRIPARSCRSRMGPSQETQLTFVINNGATTNNRESLTDRRAIEREDDRPAAEVSSTSSLRNTNRRREIAVNGCIRESSDPAVLLRLRFIPKRAARAVCVDFPVAAAVFRRRCKDSPKTLKSMPRVFMRMLKQFALFLLAATAVQAAALAAGSQPVFIVLYTRFYDHSHRSPNNERVQRLIPLLEKLRAKYPKFGNLELVRILRQYEPGFPGVQLLGCT